MTDAARKTGKRYGCEPLAAVAVLDLSDGLRRTTGPEVSGLPYANIKLNTHVPHSARIYDYLLGGKDNFEVDRAAAATIVEAAPRR